MKSFLIVSWAMVIFAALIGLLLPRLSGLSSGLLFLYLLFCAVAGALALVSSILAFILFLKSINGG